MPESLIVPHESPTHPVPERAQVTSASAVPVTVAVNRCVPPISTEAVPGERLTATGPIAVGPFPLQAEMSTAETNKMSERMFIGVLERIEDPERSGHCFWRAINCAGHFLSPSRICHQPCCLRVTFDVEFDSGCLGRARPGHGATGAL